MTHLSGGCSQTAFYVNRQDWRILSQLYQGHRLFATVASRTANCQTGDLQTGGQIIICIARQLTADVGRPISDVVRD